MKLNPPYSRFIIFSGGGGLAFREQTIKLVASRNNLEIEGVPSSFDEETVTVELEETDAKLVQIVVKKPDRRFVEDAMRREREASEGILSKSVDVRTERREELLRICEGLRAYRYEDSFSQLHVVVDSDKEQMAKIKIAYFIDDGERLWWTPSIQANLSENEKEARITGSILVENHTTLDFENVELGFVEFEGVGRQTPAVAPYGASAPSAGLPPPPGAGAAPLVGGPPSPPGGPPIRSQLRSEIMGELRRLKSIM